MLRHKVVIINCIFDHQARSNVCVCVCVCACARVELMLLLASPCFPYPVSSFSHSPFPSFPPPPAPFFCILPLSPIVYGRRSFLVCQNIYFSVLKTMVDFVYMEKSCAQRDDPPRTFRWHLHNCYHVCDLFLSSRYSRSLSFSMI